MCIYIHIHIYIYIYIYIYTHTDLSISKFKPLNLRLKKVGNFQLLLFILFISATFVPCQIFHVKGICIDVHSLFSRGYFCKSPSKECLNSESDKCNGTVLTIGDFETDQEPVKFYQWKKLEEKVLKIKISCDEVCCYFRFKNRILKKHILKVQLTGFESIGRDS